jgi:hypothetical protein
MKRNSSLAEMGRKSQLTLPILRLTAYGAWLSQGYDIIDNLGMNLQLCSAAYFRNSLHVTVV